MSAYLFILLFSRERGDGVGNLGHKLDRKLFLVPIAPTLYLQEAGSWDKVLS